MSRTQRPKRESGRESTTVNILGIGSQLVRYKCQFYPAEMTAISDDLFKCNCMEEGKCGWRRPAKDDELCYSIKDDVKKVSPPTPISARGL